MSAFDDLAERFRDALGEIQGGMTERAITEILITVGAYSASITPNATSTLINSQYRKVWRTVGGYTGEIGYGENYAEYVHEAPGTLKGTQTPRYPKTRGFVWDPSGEPEFLRKGADLMIQKDLDGILQRNYQ